MKKLLALLLFAALPLLATVQFTSDFESGSDTPDGINNFSISTDQACSGTQSYENTSSTSPYLRDSTISSIRGYLRVKVYVNAWPSSAAALVMLKNSGFTNLCWVELDTDGTFNVRANGGTTDSSSSAVLTTGAWHTIQIEGDGSFSAGSDTCHAYLDGTELGSGVTDGSWSSNIEYGALGISNLSAPNNLYFDDLEIDDASLPAEGSCGAGDTGAFMVL